MASSLAHSYVTIANDAFSTPLAGGEELEALLEAAIASARQRWPDIALDAAAFAAHIASAAPSDVAPESALAAMHVDDLALAFACANGDAAALRHFESSIIPLAHRALRRVDADEVFRDELLARLRVRLLVDGEEGPARIRSYIGRGTLVAWVQVAAIRLAYSDKRKPQRAVANADEKLARMTFLGDDPELKKLRNQFGPIFNRAFRDALAELAPRDRNVLRLHLLDGLSTPTIGKMYGVHRATVARWVSNIHDVLLKGVQKRMRAAGISSQEFDSIMRHIQSQLELSIVTALL